MKRFIYYLLGFFAFQFSFSQSYVDKWIASYSASGSMEFVESATSSAGDTYVLGTLFTGGDYDAVLVKFDENGNQDWVKTYSSNYGDSEDYGAALSVDLSDNVFILININPDDAKNANVANGFILQRYNSSGMLITDYENVNDNTVKFGPIGYDLGFIDNPSFSDLYMTSSRAATSGMGLEARLWRFDSSLNFEASAKYDTSDDDIPTKLVFSSASPFMVIRRPLAVQVEGWLSNFATNDNARQSRTYSIGSSVEKIVDASSYYSNTELVALIKLTSGSYRYRVFDIYDFDGISGEFTKSFTSTYTLNDLTVNDNTPMDVYLTGSKTVSSHEEMLIMKLNASGTIQFENLLSATHGSASSVGQSIYKDGSSLIVGGTVVESGSSLPGSATFDTDGNQTDLSPFSSGSNNISQMVQGANGENILVGNSGGSLFAYAQCSGAPTVGLGEDIVAVTGETVTLGSSLPISGVQSYEWSTGQSSRTISVSENGTYNVIIRNFDGCPGTDQINVTFLAPAPDAPLMLQPTIEQSGSPYADIGIHWSNDDPLATSHVVTLAYPDFGSEFSFDYSTTGNSQVIEITGGSFSRYSVAAKNDDDVIGGSTPNFSLNGCTEYTMQQLESYLTNLTVVGQESIAEGGSGTYSLTGFTSGDDELKSFFEWTFPVGWEITEYSQVMVKVDVAENAESGDVSVVIRNVCTGASTAAITKSIYAIKDQTITFNQPADIQLGDEAINLGATASSGLAVSYSLNNDNAEILGNFLIAKHAGDVIVTASQSGNSEYYAADDVEHTMTILKGDDVITFDPLSDVAWNAADFDLKELSSTRSDRNAMWSGSDPTIATVSSSGIVNPIKPGTITITASLPANDDWNAPEDVQQTLTILKVDQTITFNPLPAKSEGDQNFNLSEYATSSSGLALAFESGNTGVASISNGQIVIEGSGTATITASQSGNDYYFAAQDAEQSITVTEGTYTWEGGLWTFGETLYPSFQPTTDDNVEIRESYAFSIQGAFSAKNLTITLSGSVSVNNQSTLEVKEDLINNGSLTIQSGSSLITYEGQTVSDNITIKRNTSYVDGRYSFVGTPVEQNSQMIQSTLGSNVYYYDENQPYGSNQGLSRWRSMTGELVPATGYTQAFKKEIIFEGKPNAGTVSHTGKYTGTYNDGINEATEGWNLVSNPYPAAINVQSFLDGNLNIEGAVYIWDDNDSQSNRGSNSDYIIANGTIATNNTLAGGEARYNQHLGSAQGFFVKLKSDSDLDIDFTEGMRVGDQNADLNFFRKSTPSYARLNLMNEKGLFKQSIIGWVDGISDEEIDRSFDARVFSTSGSDALFTIKQNEYLAIQGISQKKEVPIGIHVSESGAYTLSVELDDYSGEDLYLLDHKTGELTNLTEREYRFSTTAGQFTDRFSLVTDMNQALSIDSHLKNWQVYTNQNYLYLNNNELVSGTTIFVLYTLTGQKIREFSSNTSMKLDLSYLPKGVYLVSDGQESRKVILTD